ncbi:MAG TPA: response regulator [Thermomicrobiaceae bacterium]|nr:response regulator [Thermomicrobiaceae bacterium]
MGYSGAPSTAMVAVLADDPGLRELVGAVLVDAGFRPWLLPADPDVLAALRTTLPDVILLDVWRETPHRGISLLHHLRDEPATRSVPIVALSASAHVPERRAYYLDAGCAAVLPEPFDLDDLLATVASVLAPVGDEPRR